MLKPSQVRGAAAAARLLHSQQAVLPVLRRMASYKHVDPSPMGATQNGRDSTRQVRVHNMHSEGSQRLTVAATTSGGHIGYHPCSTASEATPACTLALAAASDRQ